MTERVLALALLAAAGIYVANALPLPLGTAARPGPGFFPLAVGVFGVSVALAWVIIAFRRVPAVTGPDIPAGGHGRVLATTASLAGFCLVLPWTGYPIVAFLFVGALLRRLGADWTGAAVIGLASAAVSYYLFGVLLGVPLPRGIWLD